MDSQISDKLNYSKVDYTHPSYRMSRIFQQTGGQTVNLTKTGGQESIFEIPVSVFNLPRSVISYDFQIPGLNTKFVWAYDDLITHIREIQLYNRSGVYLCNLNYSDAYTKTVLKPETSADELLALSTQDVKVALANTIGTMQFLERNNSLSTVSYRYDASASSLSYTEPKYLVVGAQGDNAVAATNTGSLSFRVQLPLRQFKNTVLNLDKDLYFGEVLLLRIVWNGVDQMYWTADAANDPVTGATAPATPGGLFTLNNLQLFLAREQNQAIINNLVSQVESTGMSILIPYVHSTLSSLTGTSQSVSLRFNRGHGARLQKVYHSIFNNGTTLNLQYDNKNVAGAKCTSFYTMLNNNRLQEFNVDVKQYQDYMLMEERLKGSAIQNSNIYQYNWFWCDDFTEVMDPEESADSNADNRANGLDLTLENKWDIYMTTTGDMRNFSFAVCQKIMTVGPSGLSVL